MKIDLHVHTIETKKGDGINRNIDEILFKRIMKENDIRIIGITNHNIFNLDQFEKMLDSSYILLPGIELDVTLPDKGRKQINILFPPEEASVLNDIINNIEIKVSPKNPMEINKVIELFDNKNAIFMPDHKRNKNDLWWDLKDIEWLDQKTKAFVIIDANNPETTTVLRASNFKAVIGSDVQDWNNYSEDAKRLISTNINIEDYSNFIHILRYDEKAIKQIIENNKYTNIKNIKIKNSNNVEYNVGDIKLYEGVNIIFGPRATGKSKILNEMFDLKPKSIKYKSSEIENLFESMKKDDNSNDYSNEIEDFKNLIGKINNYEEKNFIDFHNIYKSLLKISLIQFHHTNVQMDDPKTNDNNEIKLIEEIKKEINSSIQNVLKLNQQIDKKNEYISASKSYLLELWCKYSAIYKSYWIFNFKQKLYKEINEIIIKKQGKIPKQNNIGLFDRYISKKNFMNTINKIIAFPKHKSTIKQTIEIPGRNKVKIIKNIHFLEFGQENITKENAFAASKNGDITLLKKLNNKILNLKVNDNFSQISNDFISLNGQTKKLNHILIEIKDDQGNSDFSDGEKAHIVLNDTLSRPDIDFYFLDEPDVFLGQNIIAKFLFPKITELVQMGKTIVIATHNGALGINTIPTQYIYRETNLNNNYNTYVGSIWSDNFILIREGNENNAINFQETIINNFEGGKEHFAFRKGIYEKQKN